MKKLLLFCLFALGAQNALSLDEVPEAMYLLLSLKYISNDQVYDLPLENDRVLEVVNVYGTEIDPNKSSRDDQFRITINGIEVKSISPEIYSNLRRLRRGFSYDSVSGGIQNLELNYLLCKLGGPARGLKLEARYLTYDNYQLSESEVRPLYEEKENCLYRARFAPSMASAKEAAMKAITVLKTIKALQIVE